MTTIYISQTATNGYGVGNDTTGDGSQSTPYLTLTKALTVANADDTIILNDGTYNEAAFLAPADSGLTINAENRHGAIIRAASGTTRVFHSVVAALTLGEIVIDANSTQDYCITTGTITNNSLTFNGTKFLNPNISFYALSRVENVTMSSNWVAEGSSLSGHAFQVLYTAALATAGDVNMSNGTITVADMTSNGRRGINVTSTDLAGCTANVNNVTITLGTPTTAANSTGGIYINDMASSIAYNNTVTINDSLAAIGIAHDVSAVDNTDVLRFYNNTISLPAAATSGYGMQVGSDSDTAPTGANSITNARIYGNSITGGDHGILIGSITDAYIYNNIIDDVDLGIVFKRTTTCKSSGNVVIDCNDGGAFRFKGATDSIHANGLAYYSTGAAMTGATALYADASDVTNSTGCEFNNICVYTDTPIADWVVVAASSTCSFDGNNYFADTNGSVSGNPYNYQGTGYADLAAWNAAATVGVNVAETETDPALSGYATTTASLLNTGYKWWGTDPRPDGYGGKPIPDIDITIGAIQSSSSSACPFDPVNL